MGRNTKNNRNLRCKIKLMQNIDMNNPLNKSNANKSDTDPLFFLLSISQHEWEKNNARFIKKIKKNFERGY